MGVQLGQDFARIGLFSIHTGIDGHPPHPVGTRYGGIAGRKRNIRNRQKRHLIPIPGPDPNLFNIRHSFALIGRVAYPDPDIVPAPLQPDGFVTVISGINLLRQIFHGQPQSPRFGFQLEPHLMFPGCKIGMDLIDPFKSGQAGLQIIRCSQNIIHIMALQPYFNRITRRSHLKTGKGQGFDAGDGSDFLFPGHH